MNLNVVEIAKCCINSADSDNYVNLSKCSDFPGNAKNSDIYILKNILKNMKIISN